MIQRITHASILVRDLDEAISWFTDVLGFVKRSDETIEDRMRWVTVTTPEQPDFEVVLQELHWGPGGETKEAREALVGKQPGFVMQTDDVHGLVDNLKAKGVEFTMEIVEFPWGTQTAFKDLYGNVHVVSQPPAL